MAIYNGWLYVGLGTSAGDADLWRWSGSAWLQIGGDNIGKTSPEGRSWNRTGDVVRESVRSITFLDNVLYVGLGDTVGATTANAEVWSCSNCTDTTVAAANLVWMQIGGDGLNNSWDDMTYEQVLSLVGYNGQIYGIVGE